MSSLLRTEAEERASLVDVTSYELALDFTRGAELFGSAVTIRFTCSTPGASTFVEFDPREVGSITLNGNAIDESQVKGGRLWLDHLDADNELVVDATMGYVRDGEGMHRAVDPQDEQAYLYGSPASSTAGKIYACFEQPDLKAPYTVRVKAPEEWVVAANGAANETVDGWRTFETTRPIATYFFTVCAGPFAVRTSEHDGIPLGIYARATLADQLADQAEEIFTITRQGFDYYHRVYGIRYPWGKYDQVFVPEFNMGAMENPGCVTLRDEFVFQGHASRAEHLLRAVVIIHEMAHMWFGDLVTMQWWDDLWLNESFAEFLAQQGTAEATEFSEAWIDFSAIRKNWGYAADRAPSTHPIAGTPAPDANAALENLDGITYPKGASALRQLAAYLGEEVFLSAVRKYLHAHEFGNASLHDFLQAMSEESGRDIQDWARAWLLTPGTDVMTASVDGDAVSITRTAPTQFPAQRPHVTDIAAFRHGVQISRVDVRIDADRTEVPDLNPGRTPNLLLPNATDRTWAIVALDEATQRQLPEELPHLRDATARGVVWSSLFNGLALGTVDPSLVIDTFEAAWPVEDVDPLLEAVATMTSGLLPGRFLTIAKTPAALDRLAATGTRVFEATSASDSRRLTAARLVAATSADTDLLRDWLAGRGLPAFLAGDDQFRWSVISRLASLGAMGVPEIDEWRAKDPSVSGVLRSLSARTRIPTAEAKTWAWSRLTESDNASSHELGAVARTFFGATDQEITRPYVERFFTELPQLSSKLGDMVLHLLAADGYPTTVVEERTVELAESALAGQLPAGVRRSFVDGTSRLREQLAAQRRFGDVA
ncbi:aminopeptidase [Flexivirga endophytica]|uniref:Aminopeptidase N n=1 Tax=Flexivirga endophytica TaxID=1849103 RepID=A0A916WTD7_9MICO|nr:aminopeptidase N [Flexivirga endophytica]GGB28092.1 aminopeptidase [Flexivirga endophytica]GHB61947.1 aminopeptidase [Flexivirga endophytica]